MIDEQKKVFLQACREAIAEVYRTTLQLNAAFDEDKERHLAAQEKSVIATVGFAGSFDGLLVMVVSDAMACGLVSSMLSTEIEAVNSDVLDGVGEILNMIVGATKSNTILEGAVFEICIPSVILGEKQMYVSTLKHTKSTTFAVGSEKGAALFFLTLVEGGKRTQAVKVLRNDQEATQSLKDLVKDKEV